MRDCGPWGGAGEELLGATLDGAAGRRPNRGCGPRAAAEATRHNVTKPHRPRTLFRILIAGRRPELDLDLIPAYLSPGDSEDGVRPVG